MVSVLLNIGAEQLQHNRRLARCPLIHNFLKISPIYDLNTSIISFPPTSHIHLS